MVEFETEVSLDENFGDWKGKQKVALINTILRGGVWEFVGEACVEYEPKPPDY